jgi:hypothetical protein
MNVRKHRHAAAINRLLPAHEREARYRWRCRRPRHHTATRAEHAGNVAYHPVGHQACNAALLHACAQNIAEDARIGDTSPTTAMQPGIASMAARGDRRS